MMHAYSNAPVRARARRGLAASLLLGLVCAAPASAQSAEDPARAHLTRAQLEALQVQYEEAATSSAYSSQMRERARAELAMIHARLADGDFRAGDVISLTVEGHPDLTGEFTIAPGPAIVLPKLGEIRLRGVLRSELADHLTTELGRYIRNPAVRVFSSMRVSVLGEVGAPGFYSVPANAPITDVLTLAGGTTRTAKLQEIRIERDDSRIWEGEPLQQAIIEGRTLDQLGLRAGDRIIVPSDNGGRGRIFLSLLGVIPTVGWLVDRFLLD